MKNQKYEVFRTPQWVIDLLINSEWFEYTVDAREDDDTLMTILDPSAGDNRIIKSICNHRLSRFYGKDYTKHFANDILSSDNINSNLDYDILHNELVKNNTQFHLIITNPPFTKAEPWIRKIHEVMTDGGYCIFLQRLDWLATQKRSEYFKNNDKLRLKHLLVLAKRPTWEIDGRKNSSSTCEYAWFIFQKGFDGEFNGDWLI